MCCIFRGPILLVEDEIYSENWTQETPSITQKSIKLARPTDKSFKGLIHPMLRLNIETIDGSDIVLCDFASAGMMGGHF